MQPCHAQYAGLWADVAVDGAQDVIVAGVVGVLEQFDLAHPGAVPLVAQIKDGMGGVMLVGGAENFLVGPPMDAAIDNRQARPEESRGGTECVSQCGCRRWPDN